MDTTKTIKKYILPKSWMKIAGLVLCLVTVVCLIWGLAALGSADSDAAEFYPSETPDGTMAYIDIVGVSDWLCEYDGATYYAVEDAEGYFYTVRLSDSQFKKLDAQLDYWYRESNDVPVPEAYHLEGYVRSIDADIRSTLAEVLGLTSAEYGDYFGTKYVDGTTSIGEQASLPWFMGALFCFLFALFFLILYGRSAKLAKKCLIRLDELNLLDRAARQVENVECNTVIGKNQGMLSQEFLFGRGTGIVVPYSDILWCYQLDRKRNFVPVNSYLMVATADFSAQTAVDLNRVDRHGVISEALQIIAQRNPNVLVGYSKENGNAYKAMRANK